jgi:hypothetical protein
LGLLIGIADLRLIADDRRLMVDSLSEIRTPQSPIRNPPNTNPQFTNHQSAITNRNQ